MNILITLPKPLIDSIISGEKIYVMRTVVPKFMNIGEDGFFAVEKEHVMCDAGAGLIVYMEHSLTIIVHHGLRHAYVLMKNMFVNMLMVNRSIFGKLEK